MNIELTKNELLIVMAALEKLHDDYAYDAVIARRDGDIAMGKTFDQTAIEAFRLSAKLDPNGFAARYLEKWPSQAA